MQASSLVLIPPLFWVISFLLRRLSGYVRYELGRRRHGCQRPPKIPSWDPITHLDTMQKNFKARAEHRVITMDRDNFQALGHTLENPFYGHGAIHTTNVENFQTIMSAQGNRDFLVARQWAMEPMAGLGILTTDLDAWAFHRKMARKVFSRAQIHDAEGFGVHFKKMMKLVPKDNSSTVDLAPIFERLNMDAQCELCFGTPVGALEPGNRQAESFMKELNNAMMGTGKRLFAGKSSWLIQHRSFWRSCKLVHAHISVLIDQAMERKDSLALEKRLAGMVYDFADETPSRSELISRLFNIFMPGKDTPGTLLGHIFFACARNPHVWRKLREEVLASNIDLSRVTMAELQSLTYLQDIVAETQRLYPVLDQTARTTRVEKTLPRGGGLNGEEPIYLLPGTTVVVNLVGMYRMQDVYGEDAESFRPERWAERPELRASFRPFSLGPRNCLGSTMATFWVHYTLYAMAQCIERVENRDPVEDFVENMALTLSSHNGCKVALHFAT